MCWSHRVVVADDGRRFVIQSRKEVDRNLAAQEKAVGDEITNLTKKVGHNPEPESQCHGADFVQSKYLQKQADEANAQLNDIVSSPWRLDCLVLILIPSSGVKCGHKRHSSNDLWKASARHDHRRTLGDAHVGSG